jgi:hypothetical protein
MFAGSFASSATFPDGADMDQKHCRATSPVRQQLGKCTTVTLYQRELSSVDAGVASNCLKTLAKTTQASAIQQLPCRHRQQRRGYQSVVRGMVFKQILKARLNDRRFTEVAVYNLLAMVHMYS